MTNRHKKQEKFSDLVKKELITRNISIVELAAMLGKRRETVSRAIHHRNSAKTARRIREVLKLA